MDISEDPTPATVTLEIDVTDDEWDIGSTIREMRCVTGVRTIKAKPLVERRPLEARDIAWEAGKILTDSDRIALANEEEGGYSDAFYEDASELNEAAVQLACDIAKLRGETLRMAQVADLVAAARSKNDYQLTEEEEDVLMHAERILVAHSGAYAVPDLFSRVIVYREVGK